MCVLLPCISLPTELTVCFFGFSFIGIGFPCMERVMQTEWWHSGASSFKALAWSGFPFNPAFVFFWLCTSWFVSSLLEIFSKPDHWIHPSKTSDLLTLSDCACTYNPPCVCDKSANSRILVFLCSLVINHNLSLPDSNRGSPSPQSSVAVKNRMLTYGEHLPTWILARW